MYVWGLGKACGTKSGDILSPMKQQLRVSIAKVSGGFTHSMALTGQSTYTWNFRTTVAQEVERRKGGGETIIVLLHTLTHYLGDFLVPGKPKKH